MNIIDTIWDYILRLFGRKQVNQYIQYDSSRYKADYERLERINFTAVFAETLANKSVSDSTLTVKGLDGGYSRRAEWIGSGLEKAWKKNKRLVSQALGKGGKLLVPSVQDGKPYVDLIDQSRMVITSMRGDEITGALLMADIGSLDNKVYYRFADYSLENGVHTIRNVATTDTGAEVKLSILPQWADVPEEITFSGVDHILFGYFKCPKDSRGDEQIIGVPVTYGCDETIRDLHTCLDDIRREYRLKKPFVGADDRLFGKGDKLPDTGLFRKFKQTGLKDGEFWQVFDPAIRDSAYATRFQQLCGLLESGVGVSPGILTEPRTGNATATEIKQNNSDTFAFVDAIRANLETAFDQTAYALDVLAEFYGATPAGGMGDWQLVWDWDTSMMESSTETFNQLSELESRGLILPERLVSWTTGMTLDEAKTEVDAAQALQPQTVDVLLKDDGNADG